MKKTILLATGTAILTLALYLAVMFAGNCSDCHEKGHNTEYAHCQKKDRCHDYSNHSCCHYKNAKSCCLSSKDSQSKCKYHSEEFKKDCSKSRDFKSGKSCCKKKRCSKASGAKKCCSKSKGCSKVKSCKHK